MPGEVNRVNFNKPSSAQNTDEATAFIRTVPPPSTTAGRERPSACGISKYLCHCLVVCAVLLGVAFILLLALYLWYLISVADGPFRRLPSEIVPIAYFLALKVYLPSADVQFDPANKFTTQGNLTIHITCINETNVLYMHAKGLEINKNSLLLEKLDANRTRVPIGEFREYQTGAEQIGIWLQEPLKPGNYSITLNYTGNLSNSLQGFYSSSYTENGAKKYIAVSQFQPTFARRALPCFDEPHFKAVFHITLEHPTSTVALSNTMEKSNQPQRDGWTVTTYDPTPRMSSYLLAFVICDFKHEKAFTKKNTLFRVWSRQSMSPIQSSYANSTGPKVLDYFESYFEIPFPLQKQDMIAIPDFDAGAMENWGLIVYRQMFLLYSPLVSPAKVKQHVTEVIAHELAHQWFGNLVTMRWWDDLWLNEGFATYMQGLGADNVTDGIHQVQKQFPTTHTQMAMRQDQRATTEPLQMDSQRMDIDNMFNHITYDKGASVVRMLEYLIGAENLRSALVKYLNEHSYNVSTVHSLWKRIDQDSPLKSGSTVGQLMKCWVTAAGFPLVTITRNYDTGTVTAKQERFLITGREEKNTVAKQSDGCENGWTIPLWHTTADDQGSEIQLSIMQPNTTDTLLRDAVRENEWFIANPEARTFLRVNYDIRNWQLIIKQLHNDHTQIDVMTRAQLIDDVFNLAESGRHPYFMALRLASYLSKEKHFIPWDAAIYSLQRLETILKGHADYNVFKRYLLDLLLPHFQQIEPLTPQTINANINKEQILQSRLREVVWNFLCKLKYEGCVENAKRLFNKYETACSTKEARSSTECNPVPPDVRQAVYCVSVAHTGDYEFMFIWKKLSQEYIAAERWWMLNSLPCSRNKTLLLRLINHTLEGKVVKSSEANEVFRNMVSHPVGAKTLFDYVNENMDTLRKRYDGDELKLNELMSKVGDNFNKVEHRDWLQDFMRKHGGVFSPEHTKAFQRKIDEVTANIEWTKDNANSIIDWLRGENANKQPSSAPNKHL